MLTLLLQLSLAAAEPPPANCFIARGGAPTSVRYPCGVRAGAFVETPEQRACLEAMLETPGTEGCYAGARLLESTLWFRGHDKDAVLPVLAEVERANGPVPAYTLLKWGPTCSPEWLVEAACARWRAEGPFADRSLDKWFHDIVTPNCDPTVPSPPRCDAIEHPVDIPSMWATPPK